MDTNLARRGILEMSPYIPGKPVEEVQKEYGLTDIIKMASNENPLKTSPLAMAAMKEELEKTHMYPEGSSPTVRAALSKELRIPENNILVASGGDHVITLMCLAFVNEGEEVLTCKPSFKTYEQGTALAGGKLVCVPLNKDLAFDLDAMAAAINERTKMIFLCNPNNPTSTIVRRKEVEAFLDKVPDHCIVVFDEAYFEYVTDPDYPNGLDYLRQGHNVMVIRTFSKLYGLAGTRVGYGIAPDHLMDILSRTLPPFPVTRVAQAGAVAALRDTEFVKLVIDENERGCKYLCAQFDRLGLTYAEPHANFIFVDTKVQVSELYPQLLQNGIIVRPCNPWGYPTCIRVTIGTMEENEFFIKTLDTLLHK